jgi:hypothetical protein
MHRTFLVHSFILYDAQRLSSMKFHYSHEAQKVVRFTWIFGQYNDISYTALMDLLIFVLACVFSQEYGGWGQGASQNKHPFCFGLCVALLWFAKVRKNNAF